jgi:hypothetical protein
MIPMRRSLPLFFLVECSLVFFSNCKKENKPYEPVKVCAEISNKKEAIDQYLQGTWKWIENKSYSSGEVSYDTPSTLGYQEKLAINADQITFTQTFPSGTGIATFNYKIVQEGELTTFLSDTALVLATYDPVNGINLTWWRIYICQRNLIMSISYRGDGLPEAIYQRQ